MPPSPPTANDEHDRQPQSRPKPRQRREHTRARTGCERCRARRRKCDEGKPHCQRCIDAGADCRYTSRVTFLESNSFVLAPDALPAIPAPTNKTALRFQFAPQETWAVPPGAGAPQPASSASAPPTQTQDHTALHLTGSEAESPILQDDSINDLAIRPSQPQVEEASRRVDKNADLQQALKSLAEKTHTADQDGPLSLSTNAARLMKHYSGHIVPWLDVYDLDMTFRLLVPRLAMSSPPVLEAVLRLAAASSGSQMEEIMNPIAALAIRGGNLGKDEIEPFPALLFLVNFVLVRIQVFLEAVPDSWEPVFQGAVIPVFNVYEITDTNHWRVWFGFVTLMSRLDIAYSLMNETAPGGGSHILREMLEASEKRTKDVSSFQPILWAALRCLISLADIMALCLEPADEDTAPTPVPQSTKIARWDKLLADLRAWHANRPLELQPYAETEGDGGAFPVILFTQSAGVYANMACHVAMFVLLRHRPPTTMSRVGDQPDSASSYMSPLWHARRLCGIALHSDKKCWDPLMIASFALTSRHMTHPGQQKELLECLANVNTAGWKVDGLIRRLHAEWGPS